MNKELTAVEWLEKEINKRGPIENNPPKWLKELYDQAKALHRQQIIDAHGIKQTHGYKQGVDFWEATTGEQYYNNKYGQ